MSGSRWNSGCPHGVHRNSCRECRPEPEHEPVRPVAAHSDDPEGVAAIRAARRRFIRDAERDIENGTRDLDARIERHIRPI